MDNARRIKWRSRFRRVVACDASMNPLFVYDSLHAVDLEGRWTGGQIRTAIRKKALKEKQYYFMWADEYENKYKELLPGHLAVLPI